MAFRLVIVLCGLIATVCAQRQYQGSAYDQYQGSSASGQGVNQIETVAVAGNQKPRVHEIHTTSEREVIRVEEFKRPKQIIRIHEQPAPPPEIIRVQAPPEPQKVIRVVQRSRPVRVQLAHQPEIQEVTIPIRQVVQRVRPVVYQQHVETTPVVQTVVRSAPIATQVVHAAPVVHVQQAAPVATTYRTYSAPVQHIRTVQSNHYQSTPIRYQTFSAQPAVQSQSFVYNSAPSFVSAPLSYTQSYPLHRS